MSFSDTPLEEGQQYFIHYDKVWNTVKEFNMNCESKNRVKGAPMDTLICILVLLEKCINPESSRIDGDFQEGKLTIDAYRIGKLASYETSTIKKHMKKLENLNIVRIEYLLEEYYQGYYRISVAPPFIIAAKPMGLLLEKKTVHHQPKP